jgi:hypothetical protein
LAGLNDALERCKWNQAKEKIVYISVPPLGPLQAPKPLDTTNKGEIQDPKLKITKEQPQPNTSETLAPQPKTPNKKPKPKPKS